MILKHNNWIIILAGAVFYALSLNSCKHDPVLGDDPITPVDTTDIANPIDSTDNPVDTSGTPCDPEVVYFELDVLPILRSNCAFGGCHDDNSAQDGVILTSYNSVINTADVEAFDLDGSDLYEVITDDDADKRMPPPPNNPLTSQQINLISKWILQGAKNETCNPGAGGCDTTAVSFAAQVLPVINTNCFGCHNDDVPNAGISLSSYEKIKAVAEQGLLVGVISWAPGYDPMPLGAQSPLPQCTIDQIESWVAAGAPNN